MTDQPLAEHESGLINQLISLRVVPDLRISTQARESNNDNDRESYYKYVIEKQMLTTTTICSTNKLNDDEVLRIANMNSASAPNASTSFHRKTEERQKIEITSSNVRGRLAELASAERLSDSTRASQKSAPASSSSIRYKSNDNRNTRIYFYNKDERYYGFTNFSPHPVIYEGKLYPTSEHLFQSLKFLPDRPLIAEHIRLFSDSPRAAYTEAHALKEFVRQDWPTVKVVFMEEVVWLKFSQNTELKKELLSTGEAELFENSPTDSFWGVGSDRQGRNELGKALMRIRSVFRTNSGEK